jgi:hypothetical protein
MARGGIIVWLADEYGCFGWLAGMAGGGLQMRLASVSGWCGWYDWWWMASVSGWRIWLVWLAGVSGWLVWLRVAYWSGCLVYMAGVDG